MTNIAFICLVGLLFSGCVFNPNNRDVAFIDNKAYYIPVETKQLIVTDDIMQNLSSVGVSCEVGDLMWVSKYDVDELIQSENDNLLRKYFYDNLAGCSHPMTQQELEYYIQAMQRNNQVGYGVLDAMQSWANGFNQSAAQQNDYANQLRGMNYNSARRMEQNHQGYYFQPRPLY